ncbi:malic enzyme, NAD binding domain protein [Ostertagia ostertagi]
MGIPIGKLALYVALGGVRPEWIGPKMFLIQYEDFGNLNAYRLLDKYKHVYNMFNDDIQGRAGVSVVCDDKSTKMKLCEYTILFFGAGGAATGVAEMCVREMVEEGLTVEEACAKIYMIDIDGLITKSRMSKLTPRHYPFAKVPRPKVAHLLKKS